MRGRRRLVLQVTMPNAIPAIRGLDGHPRKRPDKLHADKVSDCRRCRRYLKCRGMTASIARVGVASRERLGGHRWVVERTHACTSASSGGSIFMQRLFPSLPRSSVIDVLRTFVGGP
ncbi:hypothethical protein (plasmid) [Ralstonia solanacearum CMR15]|nr:hypothethical protein [Ralstonia solanacearum CMR15]